MPKDRAALAATRGYFGIGAERISKALNLGNLVRSAHAFGASFVFAVDGQYKAVAAHSDTSRAPAHLPLYIWRCADDIVLPRGCRLVGVELLDEAVDLPSFRHPLQAAYVLGPERGELSTELRERCDHLVRIPTAFCINVATAGAIVMYDRARSLGGFAERPMRPGAVPTPHKAHVHGGQKVRRKPRPAPAKRHGDV